MRTVILLSCIVLLFCCPHISSAHTGRSSVKHLHDVSSELSEDVVAEARGDFERPLDCQQCEKEFSPLVQKPLDGQITSLFKMRKLSPNAQIRMHRGIDIRAQRGAPVVSTGKGIVVFSGPQKAYGNTVDIAHTGTLMTRSAHLDRIFVKAGDTVRPGQIIGTVGRTGRTTGVNLHFEVMVNGDARNPLLAKVWNSSTPVRVSAKKAPKEIRLAAVSRDKRR